MSGAACAAQTELDLLELKASNRRARGRYDAGGGRLRIYADDLTAAREMCAGCPIFDTCLEDCLHGPEVDGFAAGMTTGERRSYRREHRIPAQRFDTREVMPAPVAYADSPRGTLTGILVTEVAVMRARGFERAEIAAALGVPVRTVQSAISNRGRTRRAAARAAS